MPKPINTIRIELTDLNNYRDSLSDEYTSRNIANFLVLGSELQTEGLNALNNVLNSRVDIDEIKKNIVKNCLKTSKI